MGIINTDGPIWTEQRRFSLKHLRDLGFGRKTLDSVMVQEVDELVDKFLESKDGIVQMNGTFSVAIINVLWQIVASQRFEPENPETKVIMDMVNSQFQTGVIQFMIRPFFSQFLPHTKLDQDFFYMKSMIRKLISEHLQDIDYDNPRDFIDVYLTDMKTNNNFDEEHLTVICLDFFQAGAETTSTTLLWVKMDFK